VALTSAAEPTFFFSEATDEDVVAVVVDEEPDDDDESAFFEAPLPPLSLTKVQDLMNEVVLDFLAAFSVPLSWPESLPLDDVEEEVFFGRTGAVGTEYGDGIPDILTVVAAAVREHSEEEVPWTFFDSFLFSFLFDFLSTFLSDDDFDLFLLSALFDLFLLYLSSSTIFSGLRDILKSRLNFGAFRVTTGDNLTTSLFVSLLLTQDDFSQTSASDDASVDCDFPATDLLSLSTFNLETTRR
jgi:hypothetical protein